MPPEYEGREQTYIKHEFLSRGVEKEIRLIFSYPQFLG